ncbi:MAG: hypothetical protein V4615_08955 [Bacteroidota bacterium]
MGRTSARIPIPTANPRKMTELVKHIWNKHTTLGASSPFNGNTLVDMALYEQLMNEAHEKRTKALEYYAEAQSLMDEWRTLTGINKGQTINSPKTLYNLVDSVKRLLLVKAADNREELSTWGFDVVVRMSKHPVRKKKPAAE